MLTSLYNISRQAAKSPGIPGSPALRCGHIRKVCIKEKELPHAEAQSRREMFPGAPLSRAASLYRFILGAQVARLHYPIHRLLGFLSIEATKFFFWEHRHHAGISDTQSHRVSSPSAPLRLRERQFSKSIKKGIIALILADRIGAKQ